jgi:hypothetical protein
LTVTSVSCAEFNHHPLLAIGRPDPQRVRLVDIAVAPPSGDFLDEGFIGIARRVSANTASKPCAASCLRTR